MDVFFQAVQNLVGDKSWSIQEPPSSEAEFLATFRVSVGVEGGVAVMSNDPSDFGFTYAQLQNEIASVQASYDAQQYARDRAAEYPPVADYLDGIVKGDQAQIDAYIAACQAVKDKYPKPE